MREDYTSVIDTLVESEEELYDDEPYLEGKEFIGYQGYFEEFYDRVKDSYFLRDRNGIVKDERDVSAEDIQNGEFEQ